jgi:hypothetical protein
MQGFSLLEKVKISYFTVGIEVVQDLSCGILFLEEIF